jgi:hypothetical protein
MLEIIEKIATPRGVFVSRFSVVLTKATPRDLKVSKALRR